MKILALGKLCQSKDEAKATIERLGGKLTGSANKASLCISTKRKFSRRAPLTDAVRVRLLSPEGKASICSVLYVLTVAHSPLVFHGMSLGSFVVRVELLLCSLAMERDSYRLSC